MDCSKCLWKDICVADDVCEDYFNEDSFIDTYIETNRAEYRDAWNTYLEEFYNA